MGSNEVVLCDSMELYGRTYIGTSSAYICEYPKQKKLILNEEYVETLHTTLGGRAGDKFYIITPICSKGFMQIVLLRLLVHGDRIHVQSDEEGRRIYHGINVTRVSQENR